MEEQLIYFADLFGTLIFAVTGALKGIARKLDLLGVIVLGCTVGVGGGIMRDAAIGATPAAALSNETYLFVCIGAGLVVFFLPRRWLQWHTEAITYLDAVGLGVFTALGNAKAAACGLPSITIVLSGVLTAVGGGIIRDVLVNEIPQVLKSDFYATAALIGGVFYLILNAQGISIFPLFLSVLLLVTAIRIWAYRRKLQLPRPR